MTETEMESSNPPAMFDRDKVALTVTAKREENPRVPGMNPIRTGPRSVWNWSHVTVTARWGESVGTATLGACDYDSRSDFIASCPAYDDLCNEAIVNLKKNLGTPA